MKAKLVPSSHVVIQGEDVVEIWWNDRMIGTITGADGPGVRIISKYPLESLLQPNTRATPINIVEVKVKGE